MTAVLFWKKKERLEVRFEGIQRGFLSGRKGKVIPCEGAEDRKGLGTNSGTSGTGALEAESIGSRAESHCNVLSKMVMKVGEGGEGEEDKWEGICINHHHLHHHNHNELGHTAVRHKFSVQINL